MVEQRATSYFLSLERPQRPALSPRDAVGRPGAPANGSDLAAEGGLIVLHAGERILWHGRSGVSEYAADEGGTKARWSLPASTEVLITDRRVAYAHPVRPPAASAPRMWPPYRTLSPTVVPVPGRAPEESAAPEESLASGELRWLWPQELRVRPGTPARGPGREATPTQVLLVCGTAVGSRPTLVLSGGELTSVTGADRVANLLRRSIAQFRLDNARTLELSTPRARMLSRLLIGPEFADHLGGPGQTVPLPAALLMARPGRVAPAADLAARLAAAGLTTGVQLHVRSGVVPGVTARAG
jgi:hypothetical protein